MAILAVLAALLFPVFARSKTRAKETSCATRLSQFAAALNLYRADNDGLGYRFVSDGSTPSSLPFGAFEGMRRYLGDGAILDCAEPLVDASGSTRVRYRTFAIQASPTLRVNLPLRPIPGTVVAYCTNHASGAWSERYGSEIREGRYPFVREDASTGVASSGALRVGYYDDQGWYDDFSGNPKSSLVHFPGEPWPPMPEE